MREGRYIAISTHCYVVCLCVMRRQGVISPRPENPEEVLVTFDVDETETLEEMVVVVPKEAADLSDITIDDLKVEGCLKQVSGECVYESRGKEYGE